MLSSQVALDLKKYIELERIRLFKIRSKGDAHKLLDVLNVCRAVCPRLTQTVIIIPVREMGSVLNLWAHCVRFQPIFVI